MSHVYIVTTIKAGDVDTQRGTTDPNEAVRFFYEELKKESIDVLGGGIFCESSMLVAGRSVHAGSFGSGRFKKTVNVHVQRVEIPG